LQKVFFKGLKMEGPTINQEAVEQFRSIFQAAQNEISDLLRDYKVLQLPQPELGRLQIIRKQVDEILTATEEPSVYWIENWLPRSYGQGTLYATKSLKDLGVASAADIKAGFGVVDQRAIAALAESMADDLAEMRGGISINIGRIIRRSAMPIEVNLEITRTVAQRMVTGGSIPTIQQDLLKVLDGQVVPGGYKGTLSSYAELLARTRSREAQMAAAIQRINEFGVDLVKVPVHGGACRLCEPWQGVVLSITGKDTRFPALSEIGIPPWHPNCVDVIVPFVAELASPAEIDAAVQKANVTFASIGAKNKVA